MRFDELENYVPEVEEQTFAIIEEKNLNCIMSVELTKGDKEWNMGNDIVEIGIVVADGQKYAGRYVGYKDRYNLDEKAGEEVTLQDGRTFTREKSGMQKLANFIFKLSPEMANFKTEDELMAVLEELNGSIVVVDCFKQKDKKNDGEFKQGYRIKKLFDEEINVAPSEFPVNSF